MKNDNIVPPKTKMYLFDLMLLLSSSLRRKSCEKFTVAGKIIVLLLELNIYISKIKFSPKLLYNFSEVVWQKQGPTWKLSYMIKENYTPLKLTHIKIVF